MFRLKKEAEQAIFKTSEQGKGLPEPERVPVNYQELFSFLVKLLPVLNGPAESLMTVITIGFFF